MNKKSEDRDCRVLKLARLPSPPSRPPPPPPPPRIPSRPPRPRPHLCPPPWDRGPPPLLAPHLRPTLCQPPSLRKAFAILCCIILTTLLASVIMAASAPRGDRVVHQDYIVRQRYNNALPPPPGAPKLLELESNGLYHYTMPIYSSRMARAQPINIEADAFLGMPIDLVGMPGVFEGDESSIQAPLVRPEIHPRDVNLLRSHQQLGKPQNTLSDISFLRRTQYIGHDHRNHVEQATRGPAGKVKRRKTDASVDDPQTILRSVVKGFDIANPDNAYKGPDTPDIVRGLQPSIAEIEAWKNPKHPSKPQLKMLDSYPLVPDLEAITGDQGFTVFKFTGNPTEMTDRPDPRLESALLRGLEPAEEVIAEYRTKAALHKADPANAPEPNLPSMDFEFFLPTDDVTAHNMKRKFDVYDSEKDSDSLYTSVSQETGEVDIFKFTNARSYETGLQQNHRAFPYQEVALALYDPDLDLATSANGAASDKDSDSAPAKSRQKAAYFYPVIAKQQLKPKRAMNLAQLGLAARANADYEKVDVVEVKIGEPDDYETEKRTAFRKEIDTKDGVDGA